MIKSFVLILLLVINIQSFAQQTVIEETEVSLQDILDMPIDDSSCHNYCVLGVCFWLVCTFAGCDVETSIRIGHNNPDVVVSVYDEPGANPFTEARDLYGDTEESTADSLVGLYIEAGEGHRVEGGNPHVDQSLRYKEATAVGHPMASFTDYFASAGYFCPSEAESMVPYFSSGVDALAWRYGLSEMFYLAYFLPGVRVVGEGGIAQQWGPVYPRTGFILQKDYAKASAVVAQRVGSIITQSNQPHVYQELDGNGYERTWLPGELRENDASTGVWQMAAPEVDEQCYVFGENDVTTERWSAGRTSEDNGYVFNLWRPYECCQARGAFLFTIDITPVCI